MEVNITIGKLRLLEWDGIHNWALQNLLGVCYPDTPIGILWKGQFQPDEQYNPKEYTFEEISEMFKPIDIVGQDKIYLVCLVK
jgi:hypothetical protein